jgi:CHAD domain-containing protein
MNDTESTPADVSVDVIGGESAPGSLANNGTGVAVRAPAWAEARELALKQLDKLVAHEPKVLRGNRPEAVHAIRVASRRLQEELDLIYAKPRPPEVRRLRRKVRRCRSLLSDLRNCDVLLARAETRLAASRSARREAWETVAAVLHRRREALFSKAVRKLTRLNLPELYLGLKEQLAPAATEPEAARNGHRAAELAEQANSAGPLGKRLGEELRLRWEEFERQAEKTKDDPEHAGLHPARIAAKKLRYLIEVAAEIRVEGSDDVLDWFKNLQASLGEWHDLEMSEAVLTEIVGNAKFIRDNLACAPGILKLIELDRKSKEKLRRKGVETLHHVVGSGPVQAWIDSLR